MSKTRKYPAADEKALILKRYLVEKVPMSDLCDEYDLQPSQIYRWQKQLFENAAVAFRRTNRRAEDAKDRKIVALTPQRSTFCSKRRHHASIVANKASAGNTFPPTEWSRPFVLAPVAQVFFRKRLATRFDVFGKTPR